MEKQTGASGLSFALTATAEPLPDDSEKSCAYCNHVQSVEERRYVVSEERGTPVEELPEGVGIVHADYTLLFGHEDGAGVEVPACDMCLTGVPVEETGHTTITQMDAYYCGDGAVNRAEVN